jgi:hypothetical protein
MIALLKKVGKSNGFSTFSFIVPRNYLKYVKCKYDFQMDAFDDLDNSKYNYTEIYKHSVMIYGPVKETRKEKREKETWAEQRERVCSGGPFYDDDMGWKPILNEEEDGLGLDSEEKEVIGLAP